ncbi:MAG: transposase [Candidatus Zixiibacteriota bacterium]
MELQFNYDHQAIVTSLDSRQSHTIFRDYNKRARQEKLICEMKNQYALGRIVSRDFNVTKASCWVSALVGVILAFFEYIALRREYRRFLLKRLRFFLFIAVAKFINHANSKILQIYNPAIGKWRYNKIVTQLRSIG